jgi:hypothetical protein
MTGASLPAHGSGELNVHPDTAKQMLRHSQHSTTMKHYTRTSSAVRREAVDALDHLFNGHVGQSGGQTPKASP